MKQAFQDARSAAITVVEVPAPKLLAGCVLVRTAASLVSAGTERAASEFAGKNLLQKARMRPDLVREVLSKISRDGFVPTMSAVRSRLDQPLGLGYSSAGTVVAVGEGVTGFNPGDRVACAGAGHAVHAELACIPRLLTARIPSETVSFDEAAFTTVGAVALHGIRTADVKLGDVVAVIGLGLLGQLIAQILKTAGCTVLGMDISVERADLALRLGADAVSTSSSAFVDLCQQHSSGHGVDSVLIAAQTASNDPVNLAGMIARDRAVVVAVGTVAMDIPRRAFYEKELDFRSFAFLRAWSVRRGVRTKGNRLSHRLCALDGNAQHGSFSQASCRPQAGFAFFNHPPFPDHAGTGGLRSDHGENAGSVSRRFVVVSSGRAGYAAHPDRGV